ncbi:TrmB family transcriptional regulator [Candidatus Pacearchaeota archaeon]|nr:TrmB family transcriptional regulator [Candidatus Pacearchaeota archaeon]
MEITNLTKVGLTEGEIKVYSALLDLGECTKTALAKKSGVAPSNIYDITNRLLEKGIISRVEKNGIAHFSAANPQHLLEFLGQKEKEIEKEREIVTSLLPTLLSKFNKNDGKTHVEVFLGWNGLKTVFEELIADCKSGDENYVFGASKGKNDKQADFFFSKYSKIRAEKGIKIHIIMNEELRSRKERIGFMLKSKKYHIRFLQHTTPAEIMVYKDKACIIILIEDPLIIRVTSQEVARSFLEYFRILWMAAKS